MRAHLAGFGRGVDKVRQATLSQLEEFFGSIFPPHMLCERQIETASSAYCQARSRLPVGRLEEGLQRSAQVADQRSGQHGRLAARPVKVVDATTVQLADTEANQLR